jgi:hypothetical protein
MSKLWTVKMTFEFVVVADDEKAAKAAAMETCDEALGMADYDDIAVELRRGADAKGWEHPTCVPVNSPEYKSVADYREEGK